RPDYTPPRGTSRADLRRMMHRTVVVWAGCLPWLPCQAPVLPGQSPFPPRCSPGTEEKRLAGRGVGRTCWCTALQGGAACQSRASRMNHVSQSKTMSGPTATAADLRLAHALGGESLSLGYDALDAVVRGLFPLSGLRGAAITE